MMVNDHAAIIWLTGLSGAGKTTLAQSFVKCCRHNGINPLLLDGDQIRDTLGQTGFDEPSRKAHNLLVGRLAALIEGQGHLVVVSMISPYADVREEVRVLGNKYIEVFVNTPLEVCISRDIKGLYRKALDNQIQNFTGISAPYQIPENPELVLNTTQMDPDAGAQLLWEYYQSTMIH